MKLCSGCLWPTPLKEVVVYFHGNGPSSFPHKRRTRDGVLARYSTYLYLIVHHTSIGSKELPILILSAVEDEHLAWRFLLEVASVLAAIGLWNVDEVKAYPNPAFFGRGGEVGAIWPHVRQRVWFPV